MFAESRLNFSSSYSSRTKAFTTRMPLTFSSTLLFSWSYIGKPFRKMGMAFFAISRSPQPNTGITITNTSAIRPPMMNAIVNENTRFSGARIAVRMIIMNACWMFWISVVRRVTSEAFEHRSMLANENRWMLRKTSARRLRANPVLAFAQWMPAR